MPRELINLLKSISLELLIDLIKLTADLSAKRSSGFKSPSVNLNKSEAS